MRVQERGQEEARREVSFAPNKTFRRLLNDELARTYKKKSSLGRRVSKA